MNRLNAIVSLIDRCEVVADIGTDHGYVAEMLLNNDICNKVIASDINEGPLNSAINHLTQVELDDRTDFRLGSGMTILNEGEANVSVIAGMGGDLISKIVDDSLDIAKSLDYLIIQPMTNIDTIRKYLYDNGFSIDEEIIVKEYHFYYFILKVIKKQEIIEDEIYYTVSKYLFDNKNLLLLEYLKKMYKTNNIILKNLCNSKKSDVTKKIEEVNNRNFRIEWMINQYEC
ncbi:SAM-dependent methyltransferase [Sedimentibacter sp. zth1]|uniref:tRNA (adenine(22)-N(1))-methyltransferase n=1 Tax=Sedimentibacter sp. zth1 TaxID=2816908 RepID=UPI001A90CDF8|nr:class I SAM-dependent methyltransferase [Sedimentibacter sp. zth1]QSX06829.1 SAM-dependent methyltransferase [Sedimentibacter sp. zth1]